MEQWEKNYYISSIAGASNGSSLVVMSKGWQQSTLTSMLYVNVSACVMFIYPSFLYFIFCVCKYFCLLLDDDIRETKFSLKLCTIHHQDVYD